MKQGDKKLLLIDLCSRLPYHVECYCNNTSDNWCILTPVVVGNLFSATEDLILKPYLRSLSSMTAEEEKEWYKVMIDSLDTSFNNNESSATKASDWLISKGFDVRGLIPKGLAIEYTNNIKK